MRNTLSLFGGLFILLLSFTSCLEEKSTTTYEPGPETEVTNGMMVYRGVESPIVAVYDMDETASTLGDNGANGYATIIISNRNMQQVSGQGRLTQTGDVIIINIVKDGPIEGTYRPTDWQNPDPNGSFSSNICTGMNFATGAIDDDEGMESGQTVITNNDDGTYTIDFNLVTFERNTVVGSWTGSLTPAVN